MTRGKRNPKHEEGQENNIIPAPVWSPNRTGRVTTCTQDVVDSVALLVSQGCTVNVAAAALGINKNTARAWGQYGREHAEKGIESIYTVWNDRIAEGKAAIEKNLIAMVIAHGSSDWRAIAWTLERRFPARWGTKQMEKAITSETADTAGMSTADLVKMLTGGGAPGTSDSTSPGVLTVSNTATTIDEDE